MRDILAEIVGKSKPEVEAKKRLAPITEITTPKPKSFSAAFPGIIAEVKKASPSKGVIREDFHPEELAVELANSGAATLSILTEKNYFMGDIEYLAKISKLVDIPLLRKDFIFDEYQILEARAKGASAVLLIAAMLDQQRLTELAQYAKSLDLETLGEAHNAEEVKRLLDSPVTMIGINARNLSTFATDLRVVENLISLVPQNRFPIAESAIKGKDDISHLRDCGACGFLIGETLMRAASPGEKLRELIEGL